MSYRIEIWEGAHADIVALPDRETQLAALRVILALRDDAWLGEQLRARRGTAELRLCRRVAFDRSDWTEKPRFRLVYRNDPEDASIAVVQVIAVGLRERLAAYREAARRLRTALRRQIE